MSATHAGRGTAPSVVGCIARVARTLVWTALWLLIAQPSPAQTVLPYPPPPATLIAWTHPEPATVDRFDLRVDQGAYADVGKGCTDSRATFCAPFPAVTPGTHVLGVRACNVYGCSVDATLTVQLGVVPVVPAGIQILAPLTEPTKAKRP